MEQDLSLLLSYYCNSRPTFVNQAYWCTYRDEFKYRSERYFRELLKKYDFNTSALILSALSELGGNAFDHNLGKSKEIPGVCFFTTPNSILMFDDGQGITSSLSSVGIKKKSDTEYVKMAITEVVSGRAPERRGNGLKLVRSVMEKLRLKFYLRSGDGFYSLGFKDDDSVMLSLQDCKNTSVLVYIDLGDLLCK